MTKSTGHVREERARLIPMKLHDNLALSLCN